MSVSLVVTVIGEDKPGLVEALAEAVAAHDGNWLESRLAHLAGKFAGVVRVQAPEDRVAALTAALDGLSSRGLRVVAEAGAVEKGRTRAVHLDLVGADHPGIVRDIFRALAGLGVNVEELETECSDAPMSGQMLFRASADLRLPPSLSLQPLREALEAVAADLMVDLTLAESETAGD